MIAIVIVLIISLIISLIVIVVLIVTVKVPRAHSCHNGSYARAGKPYHMVLFSVHALLATKESSQSVSAFGDEQTKSVCCAFGDEKNKSAPLATKMGCMHSRIDSQS